MLPFASRNHPDFGIKSAISGTFWTEPNETRQF